MNDAIREALEKIQQENSDVAYRIAAKDVERLKKRLSESGIEPDEDDQPGLFPRLLDTLDTPRQWVAGSIASLLGQEDYADLGLIEAAKKGAADNLTSGEILRKEDILSEHPFLRGATSFAADVLTDPLSYLTLGAGAGAKVAGKTLSGKTLKAAGGGTTSALAILAGLQEKAADAAKTIPDDLVDADILKGRALREAAKGASKPFEQAASHLANKKKYLAQGLDKLAPDEFSILTQHEAELKKALGLADDEALENLFAKPALRITSPFTGSRHLGDVKETTGYESLEIPFVTPITEDLFDAVGGPLYNARIKMGQAMRDAGLGFIPDAGAAVSKRIAAGGSQNERYFEEHAVQHAALRREISEQADLVFADFSDEELSAMSDVLESSLKTSSQLAEGIKRANPNITPEALQEALYQNALANVTGLVGPERAEKAAALIGRIRSDFDTYGQKERQLGLVESLLSHYLPHRYKAKLGVDVNEGMALYNRAGSMQPPSFHRELTTLDEAEGLGLIAEKNIKTLWAERTIAHQRALADRELWERMSLEMALPKPLYDKLNYLAANGDEAIRQEAVSLLRANRVLDTGDIMGAFGAGSRQVFRMGDDSLVEPENYKAWARLIHEYNPGDKPYENAMKRIAPLIEQGLTFAPENYEKELALLTRNKELYESMNFGKLGRRGESKYARAGADVVPERLRKMVLQQEGLSAADKAYWSGIVPSNIARAMRESLDTRDTIERLSRRLERAGDVTGAEALTGAAKMYITWVNWMKRWTTAVPSFHLRNFASMPFLANQEASLFGQAMNIPAMFRDRRTLKFGEDLVDNFGRKIPANQIRAELAQFGFNSIGDSALELTKLQMEGMRATLPDKALAKLRLIGENPITKGSANLAGKIEEFGRSHLYLALRRQGYDPQSAYHATQKALINYAHGKTKFERDWLSNIFFFYSFARGQASNSVVSMFTRPGVLTAQLHAIDGVAEALLDANDTPLPDDMEEKINTLRSKETISRFVGRSDRGLPEIMLGAGLPMEDIGRYINLRAPKTWTVGDVVDASTDGVQRTMQTIASQMNPVLKTVAEKFVFEKDLFFNRPVTDRTMRKLPSLMEAAQSLSGLDPKSVPGQILRGIDKGTQSILGARPNLDGTYQVDPYVLGILQLALPGFDRFRSLALTAQKDADPDRKAARLLGGVKVQEIDPDKAEVFETRRRLKEQAEREGVPLSKKRIAQEKLIRKMREELEEA